MNKLLDTEMKQAQLRKVDAEIAKLIAESAKINAEARWYPIMIATGLVTAVAAALTVIGKL
ncbi:hypothetical protein ACLD9W_00455 [Neisseria sp. WLZKY-1]|uniref:hypothetical protein n=1 Tax=Neisseria sp. WLZKY-1 TaxID=3390377 RepID=UPI00397AEA34